MEKRKQTQDSGESIIVHTDLGEFGIPQVISLEHLNSDQGTEVNLYDNPESRKEIGDVDKFKIPTEADQVQNEQNALKDVYKAYDAAKKDSGDRYAAIDGDINKDDLEKRLQASSEQGSPNFGDPNDPRNFNRQKLDFRKRSEYEGGGEISPVSSEEHVEFGMGIGGDRDVVLATYRPNPGHTQEELAEIVTVAKSEDRRDALTQKVNKAVKAVKALLKDFYA